MVEISGIPTTNGEDCAKIAEEIDIKINVNIQIEKAVRIPNKNNQSFLLLLELSYCTYPTLIND